MIKTLDFKKRKVLYLPSTPLNILVAVAHASAFAEEQVSQLVLIDQKTSDNNLYFKALKAWNDSPFENIELTLGVAKGKKKLDERKVNFLVLSDLIKSFPADAIAVGSDRRVEFQYLMHLRSKSIGLSQVEGWYLDDGLYSYAGRPYTWFKDSVNGLLKKVVYGFWWEEPKTVGASSWIKQAWLFSPKNAIPEISKKVCHSIPSEWFFNEKVSKFIGLVLSEHGLDNEIQSKCDRIDLFILIPHPNNILKMEGYIERLEVFLEKAKELGLMIMVKYHPKAKGIDPLNLIERYGVLVMESGLAFELVLPKLSHKLIVLGDVSTAVMTAKWLRPDITVCAILNKNDPFSQQFKGAIEKLDIYIISDFENVLKLLK